MNEGSELEIVVRKKAEYLNTHGEECVLYTTLEPCIMCIGAIAVSGIGQVIYGEADPDRGGAEAHAYVPYVERTIKTYRGGILADECAELRAQWSRV
jgi:tRNA(adenine34) deaminase